MISKYYDIVIKTHELDMSLSVDLDQVVPCVSQRWFTTIAFIYLSYKNKICYVCLLHKMKFTDVLICFRSLRFQRQCVNIWFAKGPPVFLCFNRQKMTYLLQWQLICYFLTLSIKNDSHLNFNLMFNQYLLGWVVPKYSWKCFFPGMLMSHNCPIGKKVYMILKYTLKNEF